MTQTVNPKFGPVLVKALILLARGHLPLGWQEVATVTPPPPTYYCYPQGIVTCRSDVPASTYVLDRHAAHCRRSVCSGMVLSYVPDVGGIVTVLNPHGRRPFCTFAITAAPHGCLAVSGCGLAASSYPR